MVSSSPALRLLLLISLLLRPCDGAPSTLLTLSNSVLRACAPLQQWPEPEDVAFACAEATNNYSRAREDEDLLPLPAQGEYAFAPAALETYDQRFSIIEQPAYEGDDATAMQTMGLLYYSGVGGAPHADERFSAQWHAAAAARGNLDAMATLGGCLRRGVGAEKHEEVGLTLIQAAAAAGSPAGLVKLGILHDEGESGLAQDSWAAVQCFERAAADGSSALGLFNHGWALFHGIGTARDVERGLAQMAAAAALAPDDGSEEAAYFLYEERLAMSEQQVEAYRPGAKLRLAASLGYGKAVKELRRRRKNRETAQVYSEAAAGGKKARFIRNDKARAYTAKERRGDALLDDA